MKKIWSNKGMVLPSVIIIGAIVIMAGTVLLSMGVLDVKSGNFFERNTQAYMNARSAGEVLIKQVVSGGFDLSSGVGNTYASDINGDGVDDVNLEISKVTGGYLITSVGTHEDVDEEVQIFYASEITEEDSIIPETALFSFTSIDLSNNIKVVGDIGTSQPYVDEENPIDIDENIYYYDEKGKLVNVDDTKDNVHYEMDFDPLVLKTVDQIFDADTTVWTSSLPGVFGAEDEITLVDGVLTVTGDVTINLTSDVELVVKSFISNQGSDFNISGDAALKIYIEEEMKISGKVNMDATLDHSDLEIYYNGSGAVSDGDIEILGNKGGELCSYFQFLKDTSPEAISTKSEFSGVLVSPYTGGITINGQKSDYDQNLIYAPYATLTGGTGSAEYDGSIIVGKIDISGNFIVVYRSFEGGIELPGVTIPGEEVYTDYHWQK
ncbi:hypothetical protein [Alkalibacter mobilis]|uniref:hypothetical protein n=1 Tax=Alkalibacter mobilis TaxID=2787712 RepID=UPI00189DDF9B|nr:hypothetical protein [Alkalibacter mobilis]MBF7095521.1 hypothetical protein [Alkalibacter mobilis]